MMKHRSKKRNISLLAIIFLLLITVFVGFDSAAFANVRQVDIAKIFACGMLTGVLIFMVKDIILEKKHA